MGKVENGVVSVNAYGVLDNITFPLLFKIFKPEERLKADDVYRSKPTLALELIHELQIRGFVFDLVLADRLYGESSDFISALMKLGLHFVVAIRDNHAVWRSTGTRQRQTRWRPFERVFSDGSQQTRYISETVFGKRAVVRYFWLTTDPATLPKDTTYLVMTNLSGNVRHILGNSYGLRTWIEYGFKHIKHELGWADYRLTDYAAIERWWELVFSTYLLVSLHTSLGLAAQGVGYLDRYAPSSLDNRCGLEAYPQQFAPAHPAFCCPLHPAPLANRLCPASPCSAFTPPHGLYQHPHLTLSDK